MEQGSYTIDPTIAVDADVLSGFGRVGMGDLASVAVTVNVRSMVKTKWAAFDLALIETKIVGV